MTANAFIGRKDEPSEVDLAKALGDAVGLWNAVIQELETELQITKREWHSYSVKAGWSLRCKVKDRNILYLIPGEGMVTAALVFGDRAVAAIRSGAFPKKVLKLIDEAKRYAEGTGIRIEIRTKADVTLIRKLAAVKLEY